MAWTNKRKIHIARGNSGDIINLSDRDAVTAAYNSQNLSDNPITSSNEIISNIINQNKFTDGQPLFNKDRGYLGIATGLQEAKHIVPIKVREVTGWISELDSNGVYTLNKAQNGYYSFGGGKDERVHLATQNNFILERAIKNQDNTTYTFTPVFEYILQDSQPNELLKFAVPIETNNDIVITGGDKKIQATNAQINNLNDIDGKTAIALDSSWPILIENHSNNISGLWFANAGARLGSTTTSASVVVGEYLPAANGSAAKSLLYSGARTILLGNTDIQGTNYIGGKTTIGYGKQVLVNGEWVNDSSDKLTINVPVELASSATLSAGNVLLSNNAISGISTLTASTILCTNIGNNETKPTIKAGTTSVTSLSSSGAISGTSGTFSGTLTVNGTGTHTFKGNIDATNKTITCGTLNVSAINFNL